MDTLRLWKTQDEIATWLCFRAWYGDVHSTESGAELTKRLLSLNPRPDGIFTYNDPMAIGAIETILDAGLRVRRISL